MDHGNSGRDWECWRVTLYSRITALATLWLMRIAGITKIKHCDVLLQYYPEHYKPIDFEDASLDDMAQVQIFCEYEVAEARRRHESVVDRAKTLTTLATIATGVAGTLSLTEKGA